MQFVKELRVKYVQRRVPDKSIPVAPLDSPSEAGSFFVYLLGEEPVERVVALFLDQHLRVLSFRQVAQGGIGSAQVPIGEIVKGALLANASAVILAHNHPSGRLTPSIEDRTFAAKVKKALALVDLKLLDFLVVNQESFRSLNN